MRECSTCVCVDRKSDAQKDGFIQFHLQEPTSKPLEWQLTKTSFLTGLFLDCDNLPAVTYIPITSIASGDNPGRLLVRFMMCVCGFFFFFFFFFNDCLMKDEH